MPYKADKVSLRMPKKQNAAVVKVAPPEKTPLEWLKLGLQSKLHTKPGWLRDVLVGHNILKADDRIKCTMGTSDFRLPLSTGVLRRH